jgi:hypothetical protein
VGYKLVQQLQPLRSEFDIQRGHTREIT